MKRLSQLTIDLFYAVLWDNLSMPRLAFTLPPWIGIVGCDCMPDLG